MLSVELVDLILTLGARGTSRREGWRPGCIMSGRSRVLHRVGVVGRAVSVEGGELASADLGESG